MPIRAPIQQRRSDGGGSSPVADPLAGVDDRERRRLLISRPWIQAVRSSGPPDRRMATAPTDRYEALADDQRAA